MKTINYNGTLLEYKSSHRALYEYEKLSGKDNVTTYTDSLMLWYCITKTQAKREGVVFDLDFEGFVDWLDAHPEALDGIKVEKEKEDKASEKSGPKKSNNSREPGNSYRSVGDESG